MVNYSNDLYFDKKKDGRTKAKLKKNGTFDSTDRTGRTVKAKLCLILIKINKNIFVKAKTSLAFYPTSNVIERQDNSWF